MLLTWETQMTATISLLSAHRKTRMAMLAAPLVRHPRCATVNTRSVRVTKRSSSTADAWIGAGTCESDLGASSFWPLTFPRRTERPINHHV